MRTTFFIWVILYLCISVSSCLAEATERNGQHSDGNEIYGSKCAAILGSRLPFQRQPNRNLLAFRYRQHGAVLADSLNQIFQRFIPIQFGGNPRNANRVGGNAIFLLQRAVRQRDLQIIVRGIAPVIILVIV